MSSECMKVMLCWLVLPHLQRLQHWMDQRYLDPRLFILRLRPQRVWLIASEASSCMSFIKSHVSRQYSHIITSSPVYLYSFLSLSVCVCVCVCVSVPSWALVALGFLVVLITLSCCLCFCKKMIFKKKKEKGGKETNEKNNINLSNVKEDETKLVLIIDWVL